MANLADLRREIADFGRRLASSAAEKALAATQAAEPRRTGLMVERTTVRQLSATDRAVSFEIRVDVPYAEFVDLGTQPHLIFPRSATILVFPWPNGPSHLRSADGLFRFRFVNHPGNSAANFFTEPMPERWRNALDDALEEIG